MITTNSISAAASSVTICSTSTRSRNAASHVDKKRNSKPAPEHDRADDMEYTHPQPKRRKVLVLQEQEDVNLFKLINTKAWSTIKDILRKSSKERGYALCNQKKTVDCSYDSPPDLTCLAVAVGLSAPLDVIVEMVDKDPSMVTICDEYGATALHLGCLNGAPLECIEFFARNYQGLLKQLDCDGKSPLHCYLEFACLSTRDHIDNQSSVSSSSSSSSVAYEHDGAHETSYSNIKKEWDSSECVNVVKVLCSAAPETVRVKDNFGLTPIDVVQHFKADTVPDSSEYKRLNEIYQALSKVNIHLYCKEKIEMMRRKHHYK
mmetsp:Transcript_9444/g.14063  ORF Transcript_9444/g.14063 Transcript_9444/m.14063 type:complete len:319 (-) Transcript_9444:2015-2971(-)